MGADVTVLDRDPEAMVALWKQFGAQLKTEFSTHDAIERLVTRADLVDRRRADSRARRRRSSSRAT